MAVAGPIPSALPAEWARLVERIARGLAGEGEATEVRRLMLRILRESGKHGPAPRVSQIVMAACEKTGLPRDEILGRSMGQRVVTARQAVILVALAAGRSASGIGRALGRDHSTILHHAERVRARFAADPAFRALAEDVAARVGVTMVEAA